MTSLHLTRRELVISLGSLFALPALSAELGTRDEAVAIVKKAVAYIKTHGAEKAYQEVTHGTALKDRDLYIIVYDFSGKNLAHGGNPKLVGKDLINMKDPDGFPLVQKLIELAKTQGSGWVEGYRFMNTVTQKLEDRAMYLERVGDTFVGCGIRKG